MDIFRESKILYVYIIDKGLLFLYYNTCISGYFQREYNIILIIYSGLLCEIW